jgi:ATP-dependent phosphofructokinase / diphosphate-dependent phosphofructokinase
MPRTPLRGRALVIQSGGPTAVINQSLAGVMSAAGDYSDVISEVFGSVHGLHGLLHENFFNLSKEITYTWQDIALSPGAALGSARIKPKRSDLDRIFKVLAAHNIKFLFYIGGNDSAEAAQLIREEANLRHVEIQILHVPKTIDNDLMITDHCPGYGSVAQVVSHIVAGDDLDNRSFYNGVKINVCMGRHAGWIAASTAIAKKGAKGCSPGEDPAPHLIYMPEITFVESNFLNDVQDCYDKNGRATIVIAEGIGDQIQDHRFTGEKDEFGNAQLSGSGKLGDYLSELVQKNLKVKASLGKLRSRADTWGYLQRSLPNMQSPTDQAEAFWVGAMAVRYMMQGETDKMVTLVRVPESKYRCETGLCDLVDVAQKTKLIPRSLINEKGNGVTEAFFDYVLPLASSVPTIRFLEGHKVEKTLPAFERP